MLVISFDELHKKSKNKLMQYEVNIDGNDEAKIKKFNSITYKTTKLFSNNRNQPDTSENDGS